MSASIDPDQDHESKKDIAPVNVNVIEVNGGFTNTEKQGLALVEGEHIIPLSDDRKTTKKWEVIAYYLFCKPSRDRRWASARR